MEAIVFGIIGSFVGLSSVIFTIIATRQSAKRLRADFAEKEKETLKEKYELDMKAALDNQERSQRIASLERSLDSAHEKIRNMQAEANQTSREISEIHSELKAITQSLLDIKSFMECEKADMAQVKRDLAVHIGVEKR
jgi:uncharacterized protein YfcZ (UPF0381/DUF406 family)